MESGKWKKVQLKQIARLSVKSICPSDTPETSFTLYSLPSFDANRVPEVLLGNQIESNKTAISGNVILVNKLNVRKRRVWNLKEIDPAICSSEFLPLTDFKANQDFLYWLLISDRYTQYFVDCSSGTSNSQKRIQPNDLLRCTIYLPPLPEQQKIAEILTAQDEVIALIEKQIELLKNQKKAFLQKMFPKKGSKFPEIRFEGFTEAWAERKLGEITECLDSMRVPLNAEERRKMQGNIPYYGAGNIQDYINQYIFDEELVLLLEDGDAFDDFKTKSIAQYVCGKSWVNNHSHVLRPKGDAFFLYTSLVHKDIRNSTQLAGSRRKKLVQDAMLKIKVSVPSLEEQKRIGTFFSFLDNRIVLQQSKLELEQQKKKALMQLLLTGKVRVKT